MSEIIINKVQSGTGPADVPIAMIFAPLHSPPGSLSGLAYFLNSQENIRAMPGYHSPANHHVLRVSGFKNDATLMKLLHDDFPAWQEQNRRETQTACRVALSRLEPIESEQEEAFRRQHPIRHYLKENSTTLAGLSYMAGHIGLFMSAMKEPKYIVGHPRKDWLKAYGSLAYFIANCALIAGSKDMRRERDAYKLLEDIYPKLNEQDEETRAYARKTSSRVFRFMRQYPWETYSLIGASGGLALATSALLRKNAGETIGPLAGVVSALIVSAAPQKDGHRLIDLSPILPGHKKSLLETLEAAKDNHPLFAPVFSAAEAVTRYTQEHPLKVAGGIAFVGNSIYAGNAFFHKSERDYGVGFAASTYLAGNYLQSIADKGNGPNFDEMASAVAQLIYNDPALPKDSPARIERRIHDVVEALIAEKNVVHGKKALERGIRARLACMETLGAKPGDDVMHGFPEAEKQWLLRSPFVTTAGRRPGEWPSTTHGSARA